MNHPHNLLIQTPMIDKFPLNKPLKTQAFEPSSIFMAPKFHSTAAAAAADPQKSQAPPTRRKERIGIARMSLRDAEVEPYQW